MRHHDNSFAEITFKIRDIIIINGCLLLCLIVLVTAGRLTYQIFKNNLFFNYRDVFLYLLWGAVIFLGYKNKIKEIIFLNLDRRILIKNIYLAVLLICIYFFLKFGIVVLARRDIFLFKQEAEMFRQPLLSLLIHGVVSVLVGPLIEEIIFRGGFYPPLRKKIGPVSAIMTTSLIFALWHVGGGGVNGLINSFILGVLLAYIYEKAKSLMPSIIAHSIVNGTFLFVVIYKNFEVKGATILNGAQFNLAVAIIYLFLSFVFYLSWKKQKTNGDRLDNRHFK